MCYLSINVTVHYVHVYCRKLDLFEGVEDFAVQNVFRALAFAISAGLCLALSLILGGGPKLYNYLTDCAENCNKLHVVPVTILLLLAIVINVVFRFLIMRERYLGIFIPTREGDKTNFGWIMLLFMAIVFIGIIGVKLDEESVTRAVTLTLVGIAIPSAGILGNRALRRHSAKSIRSALGNVFGATLLVRGNAVGGINPTIDVIV